MKLAILNECEACGSRWAGGILTCDLGPIVAAIVTHQHLAPPRCPNCNPDGWSGVELKYSLQQQRTGAGYLFLDGKRVRGPLGVE